MKAFSFRLESILNLRTSMESILKKELSVIEDELVREEERLDSLIESYTNGVSELMGSEELTPSKVDVTRDYLLMLRSYMEEVSQSIKEIRKRSEEKKDELIEASKDKKALDLLKEKRFKEYIKEMLKYEEALIDEYNSGRSNRQGLLR